MPFRWTVNPYRGCGHACVYCFARPTHTYLGFDAGRDFEREIVVKVNAPEVLRAELARRSWQGEHVALGTNTDPYQWVEGRYRLTEGIWAALRDVFPETVEARFRVIRRRGAPDEPAVIELAPEEPVRRKIPRAHPRARLEAVAELNRAGIPTGVLIAPLMPGINDAPHQLEPLLAAAKDAGATSIGGLALHLRGAVKEIFMSWVREQRPDLVERYERLYRRGAYAPKEERQRLAAQRREFAVHADARRIGGDEMQIRAAPLEHLLQELIDLRHGAKRRGLVRQPPVCCVDSVLSMRGRMLVSVTNFWNSRLSEA